MTVGELQDVLAKFDPDWRVKATQLGFGNDVQTVLMSKDPNINKREGVMLLVGDKW